MQSSARMYFCCRCQAQVIICSECDRGHRYCTGQCATDARSDSLKRASDKYRSTRAGRINNAARQQRYRQRQQALMQIVTHQGSLPARLHDLLKTRFDWLSRAKKQEQIHTDMSCHHCGAVCAPFLRQAFIHQSQLSGSFRQKAVFGSGNANR